MRETEFLRLKRTRIGRDDFESLKVIGKGAFGEVSIEEGCPGLVLFALIFSGNKDSEAKRSIFDQPVIFIFICGESQKLKTFKKLEELTF